MLHLMQGSGTLRTCGRILQAAWANLSVASDSFASSLSGLTCPMSTKPPPPSTELSNHRHAVTKATLARLQIEASTGRAATRATSGAFQAAWTGMLSVDQGDWCLPSQSQSSARHSLHAPGSMHQQIERLVTESASESSSQLCP